MLEHVMLKHIENIGNGTQNVTEHNLISFWEMSKTMMIYGGVPQTAWVFRTPPGSRRSVWGDIQALTGAPMCDYLIGVVFLFFDE